MTTFQFTIPTDIIDKIVYGIPIITAVTGFGLAKLCDRNRPKYTIIGFMVGCTYTVLMDSNIIQTVFDFFT